MDNCTLEAALCIKGDDHASLTRSSLVNSLESMETISRTTSGANLVPLGTRQGTKKKGSESWPVIQYLMHSIQ